MTHSPEPWYVSPDALRLTKMFGNDPDGFSGEVKPIGTTLKLADVQRIVACVNACAGIETEILIKKCDVINKGLERMTDILSRD